MSAPKIHISGILERAGANPDAPEGSQAWALAQVDAAVAELMLVAQRAILLLQDDADRYEDDGSNEPLECQRDLRAALDRIGGDA